MVLQLDSNMLNVTGILYAPFYLVWQVQYIPIRLQLQNWAAASSTSAELFESNCRTIGMADPNPNAKVLHLTHNV